MRLGIKMLSSSSTLNNLQYLNQVQVNPGETTAVYFQLVDMEQNAQNVQSGQISQNYQRYIPIAASTMTIGMFSNNKVNNINKVPSNPFPDDRSVWAFNLNSFNTSVGAGINMTVTLTEGVNIRIATAEAAIIIGPKNFCQC